MVRAVPTINTSRLTLRAMRPEDFDRFAEIWTMQDVVRHIRPPLTRSEAWVSFLRNAGHWQMTGFGQWAIESRATGRMIGQTGFFFGDRTEGSEFDTVPEAGWLLSTEAQGEGLGAEAAIAAHDWFDRVITGPLVARITPDNISSKSLANRLGYSVQRQIQQDGDAVDIYRRNGPPQGG